MKKILFTGISGLLGSYFLKNCLKNCEVIGVYNDSVNLDASNLFKVDITNKEIINFISDLRPDYVVHAASIGSVDYCEAHPDDAYKVNVEGTKNVLDGCKKVDAAILFTSSNAVYDGKHSPYSENYTRNPVDIYGKTKSDAENLIKKNTVPYIIVRLMTMYGWNPKGARSNPVTWVIDSLKNKKKINVVNDIYNNHLFADEAAKIIWKIISKNIKNNEYNLAGKDIVSRYELARKVAKVFKLDESLITPVPSSFFPSIAPRPKNTSFNTNKTEKELEIKSLGIIEGLKRMKKEEI